jgi:nitroreductase
MIRESLDIPPADTRNGAAVPSSRRRDAKNDRTARHPIDPIFLDRWSPRSFDCSGMPLEDLQTILEAGRWAPSAFNIQPWRFLYSLRGDASWDLFTSFLDDFNGTWACNASGLVVLLSDTVMPSRNPAKPGRPSSYNSFDTGAAWAHIALQATMMGYHAHAMAGIERDAIRRRLTVPERYRVEIMIAVGRRGEAGLLPEDLRSAETPSSRKGLDEIAFAGALPGTAPADGR